MKNILLSLSVLLLLYAHLTAQTIYTQNFQGGAMPNGWSQQTYATDGGWLFGINTLMSSTNFVIPAHTIFACTNSDKCECNKSNDMLITPAFNFDTLTGKKIQLSFDKYFLGLYYTDGSGIKETALIKVSLDTGKSWSIVDTIHPMSIWFNQVVDLSSFAGKGSVMLAFVYDDRAGGASHPCLGLAIDNVKIAIPPDYDVSCITINLPQCFKQEATSIESELYSRCTSAIDSMTINYQDNTGSIVSEKINNLNISPGKFGLFTFKTAWNPSVGVQKLKVWVSMINGNPNQNHGYDTAEVSENDTIVRSFNVYKAGIPVLVEYFTQSSCYYCGLDDPNLENTVARDSDFTMAIAYHWSFETPADPMDNSVNSADIGDRVIFYGLNNGGGTPTSYADGALSPYLLYYGQECELAAATEKKTVFEINNPRGELTGNTLYYSADIVADTTISGKINGYVAVIEKEIDFKTAPGSNGQTKFPWVMRKMCPTGNGIALPDTMNVGDKMTLSGSWTLADIYNNSELRVIFFVQNTSTKEVYWAAMMQPTVGIHENSNINSLNIFPNPAKDEAKVYFNLEKPEIINIRITNMLGQELISKSTGLISAGNHQYTLNLGNLQTGSYLVEIKSENGSEIRKLTVIK